MDWRMSKSMKNMVRISERERRELVLSRAAFTADKLNKKTQYEEGSISLADLRNNIKPGESMSRRSSDKSQKKCASNESNWESIGAERDGDLVFLDHKPMKRRV